MYLLKFKKCTETKLKIVQKIFKNKYQKHSRMNRDREKRQGNLCIRGMLPSDSSDGDKKAVLYLFNSVLGIPINEHSGLTNVKIV